MTDSTPGTVRVDVDKLVKAIMARRTGASGIGVFVDPVILRGLIEQCAVPPAPGTLRELVKRWNEAAAFEADEMGNAQYANALNQCADELEDALLASPEGATGTCATCRWFRPDTSDEISAPDGRCCHESEAHPLHWAREVYEGFGCNMHAPAEPAQEDT